MVIVRKMCVKFILSLLNNIIPEPKDVYEVLRPLQIICQVIGLAPYNVMIKSDGSKAYVRTSWSFIRYVILFILYMTPIVATISMKANPFDGGIERSLGNLQLQAYLIALIIFVVITFGYIFSNKVIEMYKRVDDIDREFKDLAVWMPYRRTYVVLILSITLIIVFGSIVIVWILLIQEIDETVLNGILNIATVLPFILLTHFMELQYVQYVYLLRFRYGILNEHLEVLFRENNTYEGWVTETNYDTDAIKVTKGSLKCVEMISDPISVIEKVLTIHIKLSDTASLINTSFSVQFLFRITIAFITIVSALYTIGVKFSSIEEDTGMLQDVDEIFTVWAASSAFELVLIVWVTNSTCEEANKCPRLMHKIRNATKNAKLQDTIEMYSLQMYHNRLQFYVCGLFPLDYTLLHTVVGGVTTYLVILIQFSSANSASKKVQKHITNNDTG